MSSVSSTSTLASWDPIELLDLVNPDKLSITCVGYAPSCQRRCRNPVACYNIQAAKALMRQLVRPVATNDELKDMLFRLAEYTLCRRYHQNQARTVSDGWFVLVQRHLNNEDDHGSDTSEDDDDDSDSESSTGSGSDSEDDHDGRGDTTAQASRNDAEELRRRFDELETLQREFDDLLRRQRQNLRNRVPAPSLVALPPHTHPTSRSNRAADRPSNTTHQHQDSREARRNAEQQRQEEAHQTAERNRAAAREQLRRERAEQVKRDEAIRRAQREQAERKARDEAERLLKKQQAEKARLERERRVKEAEQARVLSWANAWSRYEAAWDEFAFSRSDTDISTCAIWPTKTGSFQSCCEEDVKAFFRCRPESMNRRILRRQALRWHPDRAARFIAHLVEEKMAGDVLKTVTMISQVVIGIMGVTSL